MWREALLRSSSCITPGNVAADFAIGAIPLVGDLFDFAFKANRRNARLLEHHLNSRATKRKPPSAR